MIKKILTTVAILIFAHASAQNNVIGLETKNFGNLGISYEKSITRYFKMKLTFSQSIIDGNKSNKKITHDFTSISGKIYSDNNILDFELYHGPSILVGNYYEYTNFRTITTYYPLNNSSNYQNSSMISSQYNIGLEREITEKVLTTIELNIGTHFLLNDNMTILSKYNIGNFIPYIGFNILVGYSY